jgi:multisubunit Na+/H+ antiporter MnhC subunit
LKHEQVFWWRWLVVVTLGVMAFGLSMVLAPDLIRKAFGLLVFSSSAGLDAFGGPANEYIMMVHAVLGAVMFGWGVALLFVLFGPFRSGSFHGWLTLCVSLSAWFVPDTAYSLWSGFWQNAVLNTAMAILFAIPLAATYRASRQART